jgi:tryptophan-rich sensory protein
MTYEVQRDGVALAGFAVLTEAVGALSARIGGRTDSRWYRSLRKPPFQPPAWVFPVAWSALYASVAWSGARVWRLPASEPRSRALRWWAVQLGFNALWSPLFFRLRRPRVALVDCALLLAAASRYALLAARVDRAAAAGVVPYLGWLGFATVLNAEIVRRN